MQNVEIVLKLALEIIQDINRKRPPNPETIARLEAVVSSKPSGLTLEVWVCDTIQTALERKKARAGTDTRVARI